MAKKNLYFDTLPYSLWAMLITWLRLGALQKIKENRKFNWLQKLDYSQFIWNWNWACLVLAKSL
jgi:hypothetical protein